jgi:hypothetical protein
MPRLNPATRINVIGRLQAGQSRTEVPDIVDVNVCTYMCKTCTSSKENYIMNTNVLLNQRWIVEPVGPDSVVFEWEWESKKYNISTWWWTGEHITPIIIRMEYHVFKLSVRTAWSVGKSTVTDLKSRTKITCVLYDFEFSFIGFYYIWNFIKTWKVAPVFSISFSLSNGCSVSMITYIQIWIKVHQCLIIYSKIHCWINQSITFALVALCIIFKSFVILMKTPQFKKKTRYIE